MLAREAPRHQDRRRRAASAAEGATTSRPTSPRSRPSGADTVITGNWSNDMVLLIKAGKDAGLKVDWYTYYGGSPGAVTAIGEAGVDTLKQVSEWHTQRDARARRDGRGVQQALSRQGERVHVLARQDDVGDVRRGGEEGAVERSRQGRAALEGMKMPDVAGRGRDARRQSPVAAAAVRVDAVPKASKYDSRKTGLRLEDRREGRAARRPHCPRRARWSVRNSRAAAQPMIPPIAAACANVAVFAFVPRVAAFLG